MQCATHPTVETQLRCNQCDKAICYRCMVQTPVGYRCQDCARLRPNPLLVLNQEQRLRAAGAAAGLALGGGIAWALLNGLGGLGGFLSILLAFGIGWVTGEGISRAANRKKARNLQVLAGGSALLGYFIGNVLTMYWWDELPLADALAHFYANGFRGNFFGGEYFFTIWSILAGLLAVAVAASRR